MSDVPETTTAWFDLRVAFLVALCTLGAHALNEFQKWGFFVSLSL
jgi:hypothetical protein